MLSLHLQIYDGPKKPEVLVDGWNVYFFDDLNALVSIFSLQFLNKNVYEKALAIQQIHPTLLTTVPRSAQPLATGGEEHGDGGGAVARPAALLHRGV